MHPSVRGGVAAVVAIGMLAVTAHSAEAGRKHRHNDGADFVAGLATGLIFGGLVAGSKPRGGLYYCYGRHCGGYNVPKRTYGYRGYYPPYAYAPPPQRYYPAPRGYYPPPPRYYPPRVYARPVPPRYYPPAPAYRTAFSAAHYDYCFSRYRSYRQYDNTFQPYSGPRKQCVSPYY